MADVSDWLLAPDHLLQLQQFHYITTLDTYLPISFLGYCMLLSYKTFLLFLCKNQLKTHYLPVSCQAMLQQGELRNSSSKQHQILTLKFLRITKKQDNAFSWCGTFKLLLLANICFHSAVMKQPYLSFNIMLVCTCSISWATFTLWAWSGLNLFYLLHHVTQIWLFNGSVNDRHHKESDLFISDLGPFHMWF